MVRWMNKKTIMIMAIIFIIGISASVIVAGTSGMALFSEKELNTDFKITPSKIFFADDFTVELEEVKKASEEDFTIQGKWGIYDNNREGTFKGFAEGNKIYGKAWYNNEKVYFYLQKNRFPKTFSGVVIYNDNFHFIDGNYIEKNDRFIALWTCENIDGWFAGELL